MNKILDTRPAQEMKKNLVSRGFVAKVTKRKAPNVMGAVPNQKARKKVHAMQE